MIKYIDGKPGYGPFRNLSLDALLRRFVDEVLTPGGAGNPFVVVGTEPEDDKIGADVLTSLKIDVDDDQVEIVVDEKTWRNALRAALAEIDDAN